MDRVDKVLRKLPKNDRARYERIIADVIGNRLKPYDVVKLVGRDDVFRLRKGPMRIIFQKQHNGESIMLGLERRSETTYKRR